MRTLLALLLLAPALAAQTYQQATVAPNWNGYDYHNVSTDPFQGGAWLVSPTASQIAFKWTLAQTYRNTSAAVFNASGVLVRTLWSKRSYPAGTFGGIWDGFDDFGNVPSGGPFTVKLQYNNIVYNWALIGTTEDSWSSTGSFDANLESFPSAIAFLGGKGVTANNYNEAGPVMSTFATISPNTVASFNQNLFGHAGSGNVADIATDGTLVYTLWQNAGSFVMAFAPSGQPLSFNSGTVLSAIASTNVLYNAQTNTNLPYTEMVADYTSGATISALAVQRSGNILATAHASTPATGANTINLFNKVTGASLGSITAITNPNKLAFDLNGNLWVITGTATNGGDALYEVTSVGSSNTVSQPISGLSNPVSISVSPTTGHLFVADGGTNQQVYEYNTSSYARVSTLGAAGGYGQGAACNANIDPAGHNTPTLWLDPGPNITAILPIASSFTPFKSWVSIDDRGDMWVGDWSAFRTLHYTWSGSAWTYVNRTIFQPYQKNNTPMPRATPTRIFSGVEGMLELSVNYSVPILPGDPEAAGGNGSWDIVRNWMPCYAQIDSSAPQGVAAQIGYVQVMQNGAGITVGFAGNGSNQDNFLGMPTSGVLTYKNQPGLSANYHLAADDSYYYWSCSGSSATAKPCTLYHVPVSIYDTQGFPVFGTAVSVGSYTANHSAGDPVPSTPITMPSASNIFPIFDGAPSTDDTSTTYPALHIGMFPLSGSALSARAMRQKDIQYFDGKGTMPIGPSNYSSLAGLGGLIAPLPGTHDIFAIWNGNNSFASCNYFHYDDTGMFIGQFGWLGSAGWPYNGASWGPAGYPPKNMGLPVAPGMCSDNFSFQLAAVGAEIVLVNGDEGYHRATHLWKTSGLATRGYVSATATVGSTVSLQ